MLWTMLRWNLTNTLAIAAFCLLSMLSAVNSGFLLSGADHDSVSGAAACAELCVRDRQLAVGKPRAHVAPIAAALIQPQAFVFN